MADGTVVAALIAAGGTACGGIGAGLGQILARRSAREAAASAAASAGEARAAQAAVEDRKLGYDLLVLSINTAKEDIKRLSAQQATDRAAHRQEMDEVHQDLRQCHEERDAAIGELTRLRRQNNGA